MSALFFFSENQLLVSSIFSIVFLISIYFCRFLIIPSFILTSSFAWSSFSGSFRFKVKGWGFPSGLGVKNHLQYRRPRLNPLVAKIPWRREQQPTPIFLPGEFNGQKSLAGYSPWHHKESERLTASVFSLRFKVRLFEIFLVS